MDGYESLIHHLESGKSLSPLDVCELTELPLKQAKHLMNFIASADKSLKAVYLIRQDNGSGVPSIKPADTSELKGMSEDQSIQNLGIISIGKNPTTPDTSYLDGVVDVIREKGVVPKATLKGKLHVIAANVIEVNRTDFLLGKVVENDVEMDEQVNNGLTIPANAEGEFDVASDASVGVPSSLGSVGTESGSSVQIKSFSPDNKLGDFDTLKEALGENVKDSSEGEDFPFNDGSDDEGIGKKSKKREIMKSESSKPVESKPNDGLTAQTKSVEREPNSVFNDSDSDEDFPNVKTVGKASREAQSAFNDSESDEDFACKTNSVKNEKPKKNKITRKKKNVSRSPSPMDNEESDEEDDIIVKKKNQTS